MREWRGIPLDKRVYLSVFRMGRKYISSCAKCGEKREYGGHVDDMSAATLTFVTHHSDCHVDDE